MEFWKLYLGMFQISPVINDEQIIFACKLISESSYEVNFHRNDSPNCLKEHVRYLS